MAAGKRGGRFAQVSYVRDPARIAIIDAMAHNRMNDFGVAIDPRTGELRSAARLWSGLRRHRSTNSPSRWRPLAIGTAVVLALPASVFAVALVSELF